VWGKWAYLASDPSQVNLTVQWSYSGPPVTLDQIVSGDVADHLTPGKLFHLGREPCLRRLLERPGGLFSELVAGSAGESSDAADSR
jgi:hypothetical protein